MSASPTLCPNVVTVQKFIDAMVRFDGQAAAALFSTDGFIQTNFTNSGQPARFGGAERIASVIFAGRRPCRMESLPRSSSLCSSGNEAMDGPA